jgi:hypothetical protein
VDRRDAYGDDTMTGVAANGAIATKGLAGS